MKGVFCIEGLWTHDLANKSTIRPILNLLKTNHAIDYIHNNCVTEAEFEFYINKWKQKKYIRKYPILYLGFHGLEHGFYLSDKTIYSLEKLGELLKDSCGKAVIFFAMCETLRTDARRIHRFLKDTKALAVLGYRSEVDWMLASAFEILVLDALQKNEFHGHGIKAIENRIKKDYGKLDQELEFRMIINKAHYNKSKK